MNIRSLNVGTYRWAMYVTAKDWREYNEFKTWMNENFPACMCANRGPNTFEVRGTDTGILMTIKLRWL